MSNTIYLLRANNEMAYNAMVLFLKEKGFNFKDNELSYEQAREEIGNDNRTVMLLRGMHNGVSHEQEIQVTYLSKFNRMQAILGNKSWTMKNVQTFIPLDYYEKPDTLDKRNVK